MSHKYKVGDEVYFNYKDGVMKGTIINLRTKDDDVLVTIRTKHFNAHLFCNEISFKPERIKDNYV